MKKHWISLLLILSTGLFPVACGDPLNNNNETGGENQEQVEEQDQAEQEKMATYLYVNTFARNTMNLYYLWCEDIKEDLNNWKDTDEPISKVAKIRFHTYDGNTRVDVDRWTSLYDDFSSFYGSVTGNTKTYGLDFMLANYDGKSACAVVRFTYADSPASKAGLKRGDIIYKVNGKTMPLTKDAGGNYKLSTEATNIIYDELMGGDKVELQLHDGTVISMNSVEMYEDPVLLSKVFDCGGKKVGYLVFTSFTMEACKDLVRVAKDFKAAGVTELILDLRYNGGGFVLTEEVLASLLAPEAVVKAHSVLSTEIYNAELTSYFASKGKDTNSYFETEFVINKGEENEYTLSTADANIGITKLYAIIESGTASASEAVLCDLFPYMDITMVGQQSHGKFCSGIMMEGPDFFEDYSDQLGANTVRQGKKYTKNWGLYVMYSRFADKDGVTRCMPDGLKPDVEAEDAIWDENKVCYPLGDPNEVMLKKVLELCGYTAKAPAARKAASSQLTVRRIPGIDPFRPEFGMRIFLHE